MAQERREHGVGSPFAEPCRCPWPTEVASKRELYKWRRQQTDQPARKMNFQFVASILLLPCLCMATFEGSTRTFSSAIADKQGFDFPYLLTNVSIGSGHSFRVRGAMNMTERITRVMAWEQTTTDPSVQVLLLFVQKISSMRIPTFDNCTPMPFKQLAVTQKVRRVLGLPARYLQEAELYERPSDEPGGASSTWLDTMATLLALLTMSASSSMKWSAERLYLTWSKAFGMTGVFCFFAKWLSYKRMGKPS